MATQSVSGDVPAGSSVFTPSADEERNWFAIFTRSHHEKRVAQYYIERQIEHFLPLYRAVHQWTNYRRVNLELPLFPNYVFVRICRRERVRALFCEPEQHAGPAAWARDRMLARRSSSAELCTTSVSRGGSEGPR
jgi:hypothetical protein